jgi:large subunit ribosomal protein L17
MKGRKFGRSPEHRKAMMRNLCTNLIMHERITTTLQKAKEIRPYMERLIHKAKANTNQGRLFLKSYLFTDAAINKLTNEIAPRFAELPAGFTRVELLGKRSVDKGDAAMIEILGN